MIAENSLWTTEYSSGYRAGMYDAQSEHDGNVVEPIITDSSPYGEGYRDGYSSSSRELAKEGTDS